MQLIPGGGSIDKDVRKVLDPLDITHSAAKKVGLAKDEKPLAVPPPPPPSTEDVAIQEVKERARDTEARRRGRRASILTSSRGVEDELGVFNRPRARAAELLGQ